MVILDRRAGPLLQRLSTGGGVLCKLLRVPAQVHSLLPSQVLS